MKCVLKCVSKIYGILYKRSHSSIAMKRNASKAVKKSTKSGTFYLKKVTQIYAIICVQW